MRFLALITVLLTAPAAAQDLKLRDQIRQFRERNEPAVVGELIDFLALPNGTRPISEP